MQAVRELLNCDVNLNVRNLKGHTAQDMLRERREGNNGEIRDMLSCAGALSCSCSFLHKVNCYEYCIGKPKDLFYERSRILRETVSFFERLRLLIKTAREGSRISNDERNALLVVAVLLITITYQVVITPPGGLWQDDYDPEVTGINDYSSSGPPHSAGTAVVQTSSVNFEIVATINYITFTLSAIMTFLLLPRGYISALFKMALVQLWVSYYYSLEVICESVSVFVYCLISTGLCFVLVLFAFFGRQFCGARIKSLHLDSIFYIIYAGIMFFVIFIVKVLV